MDNWKEGYLLIGTTMIIMVVFLVALTMVMLIYRKRKLDHIREVEAVREKYEKETQETRAIMMQTLMKKIGREIHDNAGQKLTLAKLYTEHLKLPDQVSTVDEKLSAIVVLINHSLTALRGLSHRLEAPDNQEALHLQICEEIDLVNKAGGPKVHFESSGRPYDLSMETNNMILRIITEFIQNALKHASCDNILIQIVNQDDGFRMLLKDDGKGFDTSAEKLGDGAGLRNMRNRASEIGGALTIQSQLDAGVQIILFIPVEDTD